MCLLDEAGHAVDRIEEAKSDGVANDVRSIRSDGVA
jgi:hypothetical protein